LKSPPRNSLLADLIIATLFFLKFFFSLGVRAVHRSQFSFSQGFVLFIVPSCKQSLSLWSKASNLHYSLMRISPPPSPPSLVKHTQLSYVGFHHSHGVPDRARSTFCDGPNPAPPTTDDWPTGNAGPHPVGLTNPSSVTNRHNEFIYMMLIVTVVNVHIINRSMCPGFKLKQFKWKSSNVL